MYSSAEWLFPFVFLLVGLIAVGAYRRYLARPDVIFAHEMRSCAKQIKQSIAKIKGIETDILRFQTEEYASDLRAHGWTENVDSEHFDPYTRTIRPESEEKVKERVEELVKESKKGLKAERARLKTLQLAWTELVVQYRKQNISRGAKSQLLEQLATKEKSREETRRKLEQLNAECEVLKSEIARQEGKPTYREEAKQTPLFQVRVPDEFAETEALLDLATKKRAST